MRAADVGGRGRGGGERTQVGNAAHRLQVLGALQAFRQGNHVRRPAALDQLDDVVIDQPMVAAVEIGLGEQIGDAIPGRVVEQQAAEHGLLRLHRVGRHLDQIDLAVLQAGGESHSDGLEAGI
jgi:hypothetical protein